MLSFVLGTPAARYAATTARVLKGVEAGFEAEGERLDAWPVRLFQEPA
jgi:hypothetical protein